MYSRICYASNPIGILGNYDRLPFAPYFLFKDLITIFMFIFVLSLFVFFMPNVLGDSENYIMANPMQTPPAIVPEWYLLPFYAVLRSIPNKLLGVIAMFSAILAIMLLSRTDWGLSRASQIRPLSKVAFWVFLANFLVLMQLGAEHVESPFIEFGQISTISYFAHFLFLVPFVSLLENTFIGLSSLKLGSELNFLYGLLESKVFGKIWNFIVNLLIVIFLCSLLFISTALAESPSDSDDEMGDFDEDSDSDVSSNSGQDSEDDGTSSQRGNSNPDREDAESDISEQDSDDDGRGSVGMSDDLWSGEPRELSTTTIRSFINSIDNMLPDLDTDEEVQEWNQRKSDLEDELSRRDDR